MENFYRSIQFSSFSNTIFCYSHVCLIKRNRHCAMNYGFGLKVRHRVCVWGFGPASQCQHFIFPPLSACFDDQHLMQQVSSGLLRNTEYHQHNRRKHTSIFHELIKWRIHRVWDKWLSDLLVNMIHLQIASIIVWENIHTICNSDKCASKSAE